jgi:tyrosyl-tRNA synthetase
LFSAQHGDAQTLTVNDLEAMEGIVKFDFPMRKIKEGIDVVSFLAETGCFPSKGEARKTIQNGGVSINRKKVEDITMVVKSDHLLHEQYVLIQKGKKNYYLIRAV